MLKMFLQKVSNWLFIPAPTPLTFHAIITWVNRYNIFNGLISFKRTRGNEVMNPWYCDLWLLEIKLVLE